ncbi:hypothetical protein T484DRAFT_1756631 [Baffinella frigidus]|nr:hypothetical protein T484DRAFT_1756631 [Cryptophyta sp. CCMP2293]
MSPPDLLCFSVTCFVGRIVPGQGVRASYSIRNTARYFPWHHHTTFLRASTFKRNATTMDHVVLERNRQLQQRYENVITLKLLENVATKLRSTSCQSDAAVSNAIPAPSKCSTPSTPAHRRRSSLSISWDRNDEVFTIPARECARDDFDLPLHNARRRVSFADDALCFSHEDTTGSCFSAQPTSAKPKRNTNPRAKR